MTKVQKTGENDMQDMAAHDMTKRTEWGNKIIITNIVETLTKFSHDESFTEDICENKFREVK